MPKGIEKRTRKSKKVVIDNLVHIGWDPAALAGLVPHNVEVKWYYDMQDIMDQFRGKGELPAAMRAVSNDVRTLIHNDNKIIGVVHDTITMMDDFSLGYWEHPSRMPITGNDKRNTQAMFGNHKGTHRSYYTEMIQTPDGVSTVFLFHEKIIDDYMTVAKNSSKPGGKKQVTNHLSKQLGDLTVNVVPAGTGTGIDIYTRANSLEMVLLSTTGKGGVQRHLYPCNVNGRRTKNRFQHLLVDKMEPNLRDVIDRIKNG
jgi:hypothetical protein